MACLEGGADMIEVGIPFSDPVADGPVIQATSDAALRGGMRPKGVLDLVAEVRSRTEAPIVLMGYYNPIFRMGESEFTPEGGTEGRGRPDRARPAIGGVAPLEAVLPSATVWTWCSWWRPRRLTTG